MPAGVERRFPAPWMIDEDAACFIVRDGNFQALAYVYFEEEPGRRSAAKLLSRDEAAGSPSTSQGCQNCSAARIRATDRLRYRSAPWRAARTVSGLGTSRSQDVLSNVDCFRM